MWGVRSVSASSAFLGLDTLAARATRPAFPGGIRLACAGSSTGVSGDSTGVSMVARSRRDSNRSSGTPGTRRRSSSTNPSADAGCNWTIAITMSQAGEAPTGWRVNAATSSSLSPSGRVSSRAACNSVSFATSSQSARWWATRSWKRGSARAPAARSSSRKMFSAGRLSAASTAGRERSSCRNAKPIRASARTSASSSASLAARASRTAVPSMVRHCVPIAMVA